MFVFLGTIGTKPRAATSALVLLQAEPAQKNPAAPQPDS
jgi:hypothetical protein